MADDDTTTSSTGPADGGEPATGTGQQQDDQAAGLGEAGQKALAEERKARKAAERNAGTAQKQIDDLTKRLKQFEDRDKSEVDKLTERATTAEQAAADAQSELLRYRVARDKKVPPQWVDRLRGSSQEELEADADTLLEQLGSQQQAAPSYDGGVRQTPAPADMNALIRQQAGRG